MDFISRFYGANGPPPSIPLMNLTVTAEEASAGTADEENAANSLMIQFFTWESKHSELSWWKHFEMESSRLGELGFTQAWLPPPNKATRPSGQGYDAYDLWDLGEFHQKGSVSTRWGTKDDLIRAVAQAKSNGIAVIIDAVLNHKMGADRKEKCLAIPVDAKNRLKEIGRQREIEAWTAYDFKGRAGQWSSLQWTEQHFTGIDWDAKTKKKEIYRFSGPGHRGWSTRVDTELGNYDYLLGADIDHRHADVQIDLLAWGSWVLETTGGSGFRLDAIKHMDRQFLKDWLSQVRASPERNKLFAVAEYWSPDVRRLEDFIRKFNGVLSFFDVPLHFNLHKASREPRYDLRRILDNTLVKRRPGDAITFVDNHDTQIGQTLESWVDKKFKLQAYALILLRGIGHPCVFYGDLYPNDECYDSETAHGLEQIVKARRDFAYGPLTDYFVNPNCIGFVRGGSSSRQGCAVLLSNGRSWASQANRASGFRRSKTQDASATPAATEIKRLHYIRMDVGKKNAGAKYVKYLQSLESDATASEEIEVSSDGYATFSCSVSGVQIWIRKI